MLSFLTKSEEQDVATGLFMEIKKWLINLIQDPVNNLLIPLAEIALIVLLTWLGLKLCDRIVDKMFMLSKLESNKANTLRKLIKSILHYTIYFISLLTILAKFGINLGPVLAGAGILGLAIGFGAQSFVKDVITGFFIIFERQLEVGDVVEINGQIKGTVEEVGLRVTKIREYNQRLHYLPNGTITQVTNYNRDKMRAIVHINVPYESNLDICNQALEEVCEKMKEKYEEILIEDPEVVGITNIDPNGVQFTITAVCKPSEFWGLEREMRKQSVITLNRYGIPIAYPRSIIYSPEQAKELQSMTKS